MRRLLILRHAKSDWPTGVDDHDRPLTPRGVEGASAMGRYLFAHGLVPELALVSPSRRTRDTWALVKRQLGDKLCERVDPRLYHASPETLLSVVREQGEGARTLLLVGHNPGCEDLAAQLTGSGDRQAAQRMIQKYPTSGLAVLDFSDGWQAIAQRQGRLDRFVTPSTIDAGA